MGKDLVHAGLEQSSVVDEQDGSPSRTCPVCSATDFPISYMPCPEKARMDERGYCFSCAFWSLKADDPDYWTIVDGRSYRPGSEGKGGMCGFGGARFHIQYFDGRTVTSTNLWHQGRIPPHWRSKLPDNARFLSDEEFVGGASSPSTTDDRPDTPQAKEDLPQ